MKASVAVDVAVEAADLRAFHARHLRAVMWLTAVLSALYLVLFVIAGRMGAESGTFRRSWPFVLAAASGLFAPLFLPLLGARRELREVQRFGPVRHVATEDGIGTTGAHGASRLRWSDFVRVTETRAHVFLYLTRRQAYIIPKRCFAPGDAEAFRALAKGRVPRWTGP